MKGTKQQTISGMFGERVTKPRLSSVSSGLFRKQLKSESYHDKVDTVISPSIPAAPVPKPTEVLKQKKKWRLAEIIKRERATREAKCRPQPSFVFEAPHMDTRRPSGESNAPQPSSESKPTLLPKLPKKQVKKRTREESEDALKDNKRICFHREAAIVPRSQPRSSVKISGGEAILYDRSMLPDEHALLLDVLSGLESALSLLRIRKSIPTVGAVREIVSRSTRRTFTLRMLSQLAHIVPEAVAVLPRIGGSKYKDRPSEGLIIRLDDVDITNGEAEATKSTDVSPSGSCLGDAAARVRRSLLHKRLLKSVQDQHAKFIQKEGLGRHLGYAWHPKFDLERDVPELPCPPLYPIQIKESDEQVNDRETDSVKREAATGVLVKASQPLLEKSEKRKEGNSDGCIPQSLLDLVRQRAKVKEDQVASAEDDKTNSRSLLSKLPCTMDSVCAILRGDRRTAMGWSQLINKLSVVHPKKWSKEDLDEQLDVITEIGCDWCKKVALKSSRGGFAFRVVSDGQFSVARAKVASTTSFQIAKKL